MNFELTEEQLLIQEMVREFAQTAGGADRRRDRPRSPLSRRTDPADGQAEHPRRPHRRGVRRGRRGQRQLCDRPGRARQGLCQHVHHRVRPYLAGHLADHRVRHRRAEGEVRQQVGGRRDPRCLRADRARGGHRCRSRQDHRGAGRRRVRPQRIEDLHHQRRVCGRLHRHRDDRSGGRHPRDQCLPGGTRRARLLGRRKRTQDGHQGLQHDPALLLRLPDPQGRPARARKARASRSPWRRSTAAGSASPRRRSGSPRERSMRRSPTPRSACSSASRFPRCRPSNG